MPIFPGPVRHNNTDSPILDLTQNQVVGMGIFGTVSDRDNLHVNMQTDGYIATVRDVNQTYVYNGGGWGDSNNWATIGSGNLPDGGVENDVLTKQQFGVVNWQDTIKTTSLTLLNHSVNPGNSEIIFSRKDTSGYTGDLDILGEIRAEGFNLHGSTRTGNPGIRFMAEKDVASSTYQTSHIEFRISNTTGSHKAFEISSDRKIVLASIADIDIPTAKSGGMYYNSTQDTYYVGKNN